MSAGQSPAAGGIVGAVTGLLGGRMVANRLLKPEYQAKNLIPRVPGPKREMGVGLSLAPLGSPLAQVSQQTTAPRTRDLLTMADNAADDGAGLKMQPVDFPLQGRPSSMYAPVLVQSDDVAGLQMEPRLDMPVVNFEKSAGNVGNRELLSLADDSRPTPESQLLGTRPDAPTMNFTLRQEVFQQPEIKSAIEGFVRESERLKELINVSQGFWKKKYQEQLTSLENEFGAGMRQLGTDNAEEAIGGLTKLYSGGKGTKLQIDRGFGKRNGGLVSLSARR
jgi:hypothetical protein